MTTPLQRYEEVPAICKNDDCENKNCFELYDTDTVKSDDHGDFVLCCECNQKIYLDD